MGNKTSGYTMADCDRIVELMARAKAVWMDPDLLNLTEKASSPSDAFKIVLVETGKRKKALAARWYKIVGRDYNPRLAAACGHWLSLVKKDKTYDLAGMRQFLYNALAEDYDPPGEKV